MIQITNMGQNNDENIPSTKITLLTRYILSLESAGISKILIEKLKKICLIVEINNEKKKYNSFYFDPYLGLFVFKKNNKNIEYVDESYYMLHKRDYSNLYKQKLIKHHEFIHCKIKEQACYLFKHGYDPISVYLKNNSDLHLSEMLSERIFKNFCNTKVNIYQNFNNLYYINFTKLNFIEQYRLGISIQHKILELFTHIISYNQKFTNVELNTQLRKIIKEHFHKFIKKIKDKGEIYDKSFCDMSQLKNINQGHCPFSSQLNIFCNGQQYIDFDNYVLYLCFFKLEKDLRENSFLLLNLISYCWLEKKQHCIIFEVFTGNVYTYDPNIDEFLAFFGDSLLKNASNDILDTFSASPEENDGEYKKILDGKENIIEDKENIKKIIDIIS